MLLLACSVVNAAPPAAVGGTGVTAADYYRRAFHVARPEKRIELLTKALARNPNHVPSLRHRSALYAMLGKKKLAFADGARAAELAPGDPTINSLAGSKAEDLKLYEQAARFYRRALAFDRNRVPARARLVDVLVKLRQVKAALEQANVLVEHRPEMDYPYSIRADAHEWNDQFAEAVRDLTVLIDRHPNDPKYTQSYLRRCINYRFLGEGAKALADAEKALQLKGNTSFGLAARGCSYEVLGQLDKAFDDYQKAAEFKDDRRYFMIWSCIILRKLGKRPEADKLIQNFLKELKDDKWIAPVIKYLAGEMAEKDVFKLALDKDPETTREQLCEAYYYVGACYMADKKYAEAEALFKKCLAQRVNNFYEHGFAIRDLRTIRKRRAEKGAGKNLQGNRDTGEQK